MERYTFKLTDADLVATEPFPDLGVTVKGNGFKVIDQNAALVPLKVVHGPMSYDLLNATVYVSAQNKTQPWAKNIFEINDQKFILIPGSYLMLVEFS